LRRHCISEIRPNPSKFDEATLASSVAADCRFLEKPDDHGGSIEMGILSRIYKVRICVLDIKDRDVERVNSSQTRKRIFLLRNGIHCDSVIFRGFGADDVRQVAVDEMSVWELAMQMTRVIQASGGSKSDLTVMKKSDVCGKMAKGRKRGRDTREDHRTEQVLAGKSVNVNVNNWGIVDTFVLKHVSLV
jgi:hypothetical protein